MKAFLLLFTILVGTVCVGQSSNIDTICIPASSLRNVLSDAKQKPALLERISLLNQDIENYKLAIASLKVAVNTSGQRDSALQINYAREIALLNSQKADYELRVATLEKQLKKAIRRTKWAGFTGLLLTVGAFFFMR